MPIDNTFYNALPWWDERTPLHYLRTGLNPARFGYCRAALQRCGIDPAGARALDIGCGGGFLAEEFARLGCLVTGIDPSAPTVAVAARHAAQQGLTITYCTARGERLPFPNAAFDFAYCCDVLEHVRDRDRVIAEAARVLAPGGIFLYDTINRTFLSKLVVIKLAQEWRWSAFAIPGLHDWAMFVTPAELSATFGRHGLKGAAIVGLQPRGNPLTLLRAIRAARRDHLRGDGAADALRAKQEHARLIHGLRDEARSAWHAP